MTSSTTTGQQTTEGRSVRDIVEHDPDQVNEAWCRRIYRKLLQSLELQYAMQMPHRAITADTVVFHDNGEPLLLPSIVSDPDPDQAGDLTALARLIHYAITQELIPTGPLHGRRLAGYSDALIAAVDRCMDPDPERRPQTIDEMRDILGVVALGSRPLAASLPPPFADEEPDEQQAPTAEPAAAQPTPPAPQPPAPAPAPIPAPAPAPAAEPEPGPAAQQALPPLRNASINQPPQAGAATSATASTAGSAAESAAHFSAEPAAGSAAPLRHTAAPAPKPGLSRRQRQAMAAGGAAILLAIALAVFAEMRDAGSFGDPVLTLPPPAAGQPQSAGAGPAALPAGSADTTQQAASATPAPYGATPDAAGSATPADAAALPPAAGATGAAGMPGTPLPAPAKPPAAPAPPVKGSASYNLQIQPWGTVYVDGAERGVSPPIKRLVLAPGRHTIRVTNPNFTERTLEVDTAVGDGRIAVDFSESSE